MITEFHFELHQFLGLWYIFYQLDRPCADIDLVEGVFKKEVDFAVLDFVRFRVLA